MDGFVAFWANLWQYLSSEFIANFVAEKRYMLFVNGLGVTIFISIFAIVLGVILGTAAYFLRRSRFSFLRAIGYVYVDVIRGTPVVTQLFIIYFVIFRSVHINPVFIAVIAFGLNSGAYVSEIIRAGFQSIDIGQTEAGRSLGLTSRQTLSYIVGPQAIKNILPALANEFIVLVKETAVVGYLSVQDLTRAADVVRSRTFNEWMPLIGAAIIYYVLVKILAFGVGVLERKLRASDHRS